MQERQEQLASDTFEKHIRNNRYPGRGLIIGLGEDGKSFYQVYWIMGRSENSRNRVFIAEKGRLRTEPADPEKCGDPRLIIYNAMRELNGYYIVTNGDQTDTVVQSLLYGGGFQNALTTRDREPDAPNFTPRISGILETAVGRPIIKLALLRASRFSDDRTDRFFYCYQAHSPGFGYGLTTYTGDGSPLPPFRGDPLLLPLSGDADTLAETYWNALDKDNRVSLAVKHIPPCGPARITCRNAYEKTG